ncbi:calmodulin-binding transcription activator 3 isoform X2 [Capsicum annuum]|uniref:calmodulin-binding transcription activator 3 isoform X2 n=2 Tax=Capsicum annuum TaxID=4072 RepID=UPI0007BF3903|nr:calmodulin-binding transcription activator 3 isoform X2 [Capsicum annuum]
MNIHKSSQVGLCDLEHILQEANHRWLRPHEICEILRNHQSFYLTQQPPDKPPGGSLFLFDRKVVRYFRKDGHNWRKKKDGKTVKEAHEKLKAGSSDVLHCYYAHGEDNKNFQRRSYWMLEEKLERIILVHYREVKEGYKVGASRLQPVHPGPVLENPQSSSTPWFESGLIIVQESHTSNPSSVDSKEQAPSSELHSDDSKGLVELSRDSFQLNSQVSSLMSAEFHGSCRNLLNVTLQQKFYSGNLTVADLLSCNLTYGRWDAGKAVKDVANIRNRLTITSGEVFEENIHVAPGHSLSPDKLFSISDFSPDWVYSGVETKVLIIGTFLDLGKRPTCQKWSCMFGEVEVPAEVLNEGVIRCQVPSHAPGLVPFYLTCSNRVACSEVREFEYRENPSELALAHRPSDEECVEVQLAKLLYSGLNKKLLDCSSGECEKCKLKTLLCSLKFTAGNASERLEDLLSIIEGNHIIFGDVLNQSIMKDKLYEWLVSRAHEEDKGPNILDDGGRGVIHLVASLGYEWGLLPLIAAGISPNFRDARGRTALHWAAHYGREDMVIALIKLGVAAGAVDDPTTAFPGGRTAADLAFSRGHKGIAGYLAESDLTALHQSLGTNNNALDSIAAGLEAEKAFESAAQEVVPLNGTIDDDISLKGSLASLTKSAQAAALIRAAFRSHSFRQRQLTKSRNDVFEDSPDLVSLGSLNKVQKVNHYEDYLHSAAIKIQQNYHGWNGRREFLKIQNRIVKIQAHVHGHHVRKQYEKFVWSVSILEKVILRWRRKKTGLRGFRSEKASQKGALEKEDEYEYLSVGRKQKLAGVEKALARVQSMVRHPEARDQYMRLVTKFESTKLDDGGAVDRSSPI